MGKDADGSPEHREQIFQMVFVGEAFTVKGERVSLRRLFSWLSAADKYLPLWHSRLMALLATGQSFNVHKHFTEVP